MYNKDVKGRGFALKPRNFSGEAYPRKGAAASFAAKGERKTKIGAFLFVLLVWLVEYFFLRGIQICFWFHILFVTM